MVNYQWNIFWADLDPSRGSEQAGRRPVLVISAEQANQSLPIVTVLSITSVKPGRKVYPVETFLGASLSGLPKDSIAMAHQIRAISKDRLGDKCGGIEDEGIKGEIQAAIKIYLDIS
jgi:mRNA interferase MazF